MPFHVKRAILFTCLTLCITGLTWLLTTTLAAAAVAGSTITVCPAGPPTCDFATITDGLDTAQSGDTVLVYSGTYSEQVTLKSGVALRASDGPTSTTITAATEPIISANGVVSAVLEGFTISGLDITALGIHVISSELTISNTVIEDLRGADGTLENPGGEFATGIDIDGPSTVTVANTLIQMLMGGYAYPNGGSGGGGATALWVFGDVQLTVISTSIRHLYAGGVPWAKKTSCPAYGGNAMAIGLAGNVNLFMRDSEISWLDEGSGCIEYNGVTQGWGTVLGIHALGGTVHLVNNHITWLDRYAPSDSYALYTLDTNGVHLENNRIYFWPYLNPQNLKPTLPAYSEPIRFSALVASHNDAQFTAINNDIGNSILLGIAGELSGFRIEGTTAVTITDNTIRHLLGASTAWYSWHPQEPGKAIGIDLHEVGTAYISANQIHDLVGGAAYGQLFSEVNGGNALGARIVSVDNIFFENNLVSRIIPGPASEPYYMSGGFGFAVQVYNSSVQILNNTFYDMMPMEGLGSAWPGYGMGLLIESDVTAVNNIFMKQQLAISGQPTYTMHLDYNTFWDNEQNYNNAPAGEHDLYTNPLFVDPENGDFHLSPNSPLIDAGATNITTADFEGEPRPLDGNNDGQPLPDIGADEFYPGLLGSLKTVDKAVADPGDTLLYTFHIANPSDWLPINSAYLSDALPAYVNYVPGSLQASAGSWGYSIGVITWTGNIPAGQFVTLTFQATIQPDLTGTHTIVNQAHLTDPIGAQPTIIQATTLVNPHQLYFPLIPKP